MMANLIKDDVTNVLDITAVCYFGYPFVVGQCNTVDEAERAIEIAREVTGKPPIPYLMKKGAETDCNPALDLAISTEVTARLVADKKIFATNVVVKSIQCEVVLLGVLGSKESILAAIDHANKVNGVKKIRSFLVSTDTGRSWDSVFKSMGEMTKGSDNTVFVEDGSPLPSVKKEEPPTTEENTIPQ
jgi:hyperosmotically inducible protein